MSPQEIVDTVISVLTIITSWPVVSLLLALLFLKELRSIILDIGRRLKRAPGGFEFSEARVKALQNTIQLGAEEFRNDPPRLLSFVEKELNDFLGGGAKIQGSFSPLSGRSVLWLDDDPASAEYAKRLFTRLGASLTVARSREEASEVLQQQLFDIVISQRNDITIS